MKIILVLYLIQVVAGFYMPYPRMAPSRPPALSLRLLASLSPRLPSALFEGGETDGATRPYFKVDIEYCPGCRWLLRAGWLAQELLMTFQTDIDEVAIKPSKVSGTFNVAVNGEVVFSRSKEGRFPEAKEVKQLVRNIACPEKGLGHSDTPVKKEEA